MFKKITTIALIAIFLTVGTVAANNYVYNDVENEAWYSTSVKQVSDLKIMQGYSDGSFKPNQTITRAEIAKIASSIVNLQREELNKALSAYSGEQSTTDQKVINTVANAVPSVVVIEVPTSSTSKDYGSGFIVKGNRIITNHHVIKSADQIIKVRLSSGKTYEAEIANIDEYNDIAELKINENDPLPYLNVSNEIKTGQTVIVLGHPRQLEYSVTKGIVSHENRYGRIQIDAPLNPGNSGGPILNLNGDVIAIAAGVSRGDNGEINNLGFGIAAEYLEAFLNGEKLITFN